MDIIAVLSILFHDLSFSMPVRFTYNEKKEKNGLCDLYEKGGISMERPPGREVSEAVR